MFSKYYWPGSLKGPFAQRCIRIKVSPAINTSNCCFGVEKLKLLLGWTSGLFCRKAKGPKLTFLASINFFTKMKNTNSNKFGQKMSKFGPTFWKKWTNLDQKLAKVQILIPIFVFFILVKKIIDAKNVNFGPLTLQQKRPEVHPSNNFNFFTSKQQFVMLMAGETLILLHLWANGPLNTKVMEVVQGWGGGQRGQKEGNIGSEGPR